MFIDPHLSRNHIAGLILGLLSLIGIFSWFIFSYQGYATAQDSLSLQCRYAICINSERSGGQDQKPSSVFPIVARIEPYSELEIKIFGPELTRVYDKSFHSDENGWVEIEYPIPSNATEGYYRVYLSTISEEGKSYSSLLFTIGNVYSSEDKPFHIGVADATQNGEYKQIFDINRPIDVLFKLSNPYVDVPSGISVNIILNSDQSGVLENTAIYTQDGNGFTTALYSFVPNEYGFYDTLAKVTYGGFSSEYRLGLKVRPSPGYTFEVEGKASTVIIDRDGDIGKIRSVNLDASTKKLNIEIEKERAYNVLEIRLPYELLGDPYTVLTEGEKVNLGETSLSGSITKDQTFAIIRVPVDDSVSHIEIIGTTVIPEFGALAGLLGAVGMASIIVILRNVIPRM